LICTNRRTQPNKVFFSDAKASTEMTKLQAEPARFTDPAPQALSKKLLFILASCAGLAVANLYYAQPLLALIADSFNAPTTIGLVAVATQVGYTFGILFVLPLGDLIDRRRLTVSLGTILVLAALGCALAPSLRLLALASLLVGFGATITQVMVPFAADLALPEQRGRAVGVVFSGLLAGILLARTVGGAIGQLLGWRAMFGLASVIALLLVAILRISLPKTKPKTSQSYLGLMRSMIALLAKHRSLRCACAVQACLFAIFSAFWSTLALLLAKPPFELGAAAAGAFGIVGLVGVGAANVSGRLIDRYGSRRGLFVGVTCCVLSYAVFLADVSLRGLVFGIVLLDFGLSIANVSNQSKILGLDLQATSRINTIYVTAIFLGGSIGTAIASAAWVGSGWSAVCVFGLAAALLAFVINIYDWAVSP
jgi:predicted MFS family arabinose efflux permease